LNTLLDQKAGSTKPDCRVQVLPVQWRREIRFGVSDEDNDDRKKMEEGDVDYVSSDDEVSEANENPTLQDITGEGLSPIRGLISEGTNHDYPEPNN
jgi:hypothetical protein